MTRYGRPVSIQQNPSTTGHSSRCELVQISFARVLAALPSCSVWGVIWLFSHAQGFATRAALTGWHASGWPPPVRDSSGLYSVRSVYALSIGKACAAVPALAVLAGGQLARLAAALLAVVLTLPATALSVAAGGVAGCGWCYTLAALLGARWRPNYGPYGVMAGAGLSVLLAWPSRAARGWRWRGLDRLRVVLAAVAVRTAPAAAVAVAGASIKRARRRGP